MPLFWTKWLRDMGDAQHENGAVPDVCPGYPDDRSHPAPTRMARRWRHRSRPKGLGSVGEAERVELGVAQFESQADGGAL